MAKFDLRRALRGAGAKRLEDLVPPDTIFHVADDRGTIAGTPNAGTPCTVDVDGDEVGTVQCGEHGERFARMVAYLYATERDKRALGAETLDRYKELALLYGLSEALAHETEVAGVAHQVCAAAFRYLRADSVEVFVMANGTEPLARAGTPEWDDAGWARAGALEAEVLETREAQFVEDVRGPRIGGREAQSEQAQPQPPEENTDKHRSFPRSVLCAPLLTGDCVIGTIRATSVDVAHWNAGDLKLVAALGAIASSAVGHALLHQERVRALELRANVGRFLSPEFREAAVSGGDPQVPGAVVFCDLGEVARTADTTLPAQELFHALDASGCSAVAALLARGAAVNLAREDLLIAVFANEPDFAGRARTAIDAARDARDALAAVGRSGVGVGRVALGSSDRFLADISAVISLQSRAAGRILADSDVAGVLPGRLAEARHDGLDPADSTPAYEVV